MALIASYFRLPGLGDLSFYGDEEYSALAVQGILADGYPHMPSGMAYWRGALYSYLAAGSAWLLGITEMSIRMPSAIFGILAPPILYVIAKRTIGLVPAVLAAWLLVFSFWHIDISREGRMYSMFLTCFLLTVFCFLKGVMEDSRLFRYLTILIAMITVTIHELGIFLVVFSFLALVLVGNLPQVRTRWLPLAVTSCLLGGGWFLYQRFESFVVPGSGVSSAPSHTGFLLLIQNTLHLGFAPKFWMLTHILEHHLLFYVALVLMTSFSTMMAWWALRKHEAIPKWMPWGVAILVVLSLGNFFGLILVSLMIGLCFEGRRAFTWLRFNYVRLALLILLGVFTFWFFYGVFVWTGEGLNITSDRELVRKILKDSFYYPAMHILMYFEAFPLMTGVVLFATGWWFLFLYEGNVSLNPEALIFIWFWIPLLILGFPREWIGLRYTIHLYPFFLMIFAWAVFRVWQSGLSMFSRFGKTGPSTMSLSSFSKAMVLTIMLLAFPVFNETHSLRAAMQASRLGYAEGIPPLLHGFSLHPDHKGAGEYVKAHLKEDDLIIAIDLFQQFYYIGRVDYWLRYEDQKDMYAYKDGRFWYDIYTKTKVIASQKEVNSVLRENRDSRVWLITSAEWPDALLKLVPSTLLSRGRVVYTGRDTQTRVYLFLPST